jgi:hypothetical protein
MIPVQLAPPPLDVLVAPELVVVVVAAPPDPPSSLLLSSPPHAQGRIGASATERTIQDSFLMIDPSEAQEAPRSG